MVPTSDRMEVDPHATRGMSWVGLVRAPFSARRTVIVWDPWSFARRSVARQVEHALRGMDTKEEEQEREWGCRGGQIALRLTSARSLRVPKRLCQMSA